MTSFLAADLFDTPTVTFTVETKRGPAVLAMRPLTADNLAFISDVLERERLRKSAPVEDPPPLTHALLVGRRADEATDVHRWCFESMTLGGDAVSSEDALTFLREVAVHKQTLFRDLVRAIEAQPEEAAQDALAGESSAG